MDYVWVSGDVFVDKWGGEFVKFWILLVCVELDDDGFLCEVFVLWVE